MSGQTEKNRGCFFYGFLTAALVFIGVVVGLYFGTRKAIKTAVANYTSTSATPIPQLNLPAAEQNRIADSIEKSAEAAMKSGEGGSISLDETELNVLLAQSPDLKSISQHMYVRPTGTNLEAQVSLPLDEFKSWQQLAAKLGPSLKGRYLNGTATLEVASTNHEVEIHLKGLMVNGKSLPESFINKVQVQNLASDANQNPNFRSVIQQIESIRTESNKVVVQFAPTAKK